ncbi:anchored repeat-type ABC transporter, ATP-binding subunit [Gleimia coleocanis DSM 15436]|uniref:Anchored repeat-type ABC transporter, ATP-binding subunit n=1 Tax=Gleimia coleocanis DSM 15436 TaxID=525245 RepID=C0W236_9ACTO|nr:anchored repeat-type ABC transporter ATP-binding subunit [Gleimia coleocanis]EEH63250.1 anchored repeat-type ABC transporter, ATP-binding subunit [Gleimia coleocanis DSM 15436]
MNHPLEVTNLCTDLGRRRVLTDVNLTVGSGKFVGLIGPNGAGKTTLLRSILGLIPTRQGEVKVSGLTGNKARDLIGYVPQRHEFAWDFPIDVKGVVMTGRTRRIGWLRQPKAADYQAVHAALEKVKMVDLAKRPVGELSGGQRQRVLMARALVTNPDILLLDEPFTGLDMPSQELLLELFQDLAASGTSLLMSTHDLGSAADVCHEMILLNKTVVAQGTAAELADPELWMRTFSVKANSPLLRTVGVRS